MKKAIGYIRVSKGSQVEEGFSLDTQKAKIEAWCLANDYAVECIFMDAGISGKNIKQRPGLIDAIKAVKKDMALVVHSLSRLARNTHDTLQIANSLNAIGADLVSLSEKIDTTGAMGKMAFTIMAAFSQFERDMASDRIKATLRHKKSVGQKYSPIPFGYADVDGNLVPIESEALIVAKIIKDSQEGKALLRIARELNESGIPGKRGGKWYASTVQYVINRQAIGYKV